MNSDDLADLVTSLLRGATGAGNDVFGPEDWPVPTRDTPTLQVQTPHDIATARTRGQASFVTVSTIRVIGEITAKSQVDSTGAERAKSALSSAIGLLARQVKKALIGNPAIMREVNYIQRIETITGIRGDQARHVGTLVMDFDFEFPEDPEDFGIPSEAVPLEQFEVYGDLINIFDPSGTYTPPMASEIPTEAPRDSGPDGRVEVGIVTNVQGAT